MTLIVLIGTLARPQAVSAKVNVACLVSLGSHISQCGYRAPLIAGNDVTLLLQITPTAGDSGAMAMHARDNSADLPVRLVTG